MEEPRHRRPPPRARSPSRSHGSGFAWYRGRRNSALKQPGFFLNIYRNARAFCSVSCLAGYALMLNGLQVTTLSLYPVLARPTLIYLNSLISAALTTVLQTFFEPAGKKKMSYNDLSPVNEAPPLPPVPPIITYSGDVLTPDEGGDSPESAIIISNHVAWSDFYLVHSIAKRRNMLYACKYFCKESLKWIPGFGWGMWLVGYLFIKRSWTSDRASIDETFSQLIRYHTPVWLINYVEGTRFTPEKCVSSQKYAEERGLSVYRNVLYPRVKGFVATVQALRSSHVTALYDLTLCYNHRTSIHGIQKPPTMWRVHTHSLFPEYQFHVRIRRYVLADLPDTEEGLSEWILARWQEKDDYLQALKDSGGKWVTDSDIRDYP